mmetsp:Transcript_39250/g.91574  ORF Transcript_39250/g.91574 Transcript_39250/m.91574 type:complete len:410 (+) Transcript_39250:399-1628(+)
MGGNGQACFQTDRHQQRRIPAERRSHARHRRAQIQRHRPGHTLPRDGRGHDEGSGPGRRRPDRPQRIHRHDGQERRRLRRRHQGLHRTRPHVPAGQERHPGPQEEPGGEPPRFRFLADPPARLEERHLGRFDLRLGGHHGRDHAAVSGMGGDQRETLLDEHILRRHISSGRGQKFLHGTHRRERFRHHGCGEGALELSHGVLRDGFSEQHTHRSHTASERSGKVRQRQHRHRNKTDAQDAAPAQNGQTVPHTAHQPPLSIHQIRLRLDGRKAALSRLHRLHQAAPPGRRSALPRALDRLLQLLSGKVPQLSPRQLGGLLRSADPLLVHPVELVLLQSALPDDHDRLRDPPLHQRFLRRYDRLVRHRNVDHPRLSLHRRGVLLPAHLLHLRGPADGEPVRATVRGAAPAH